MKACGDGEDRQGLCPPFSSCLPIHLLLLILILTVIFCQALDDELVPREVMKIIADVVLHIFLFSSPSSAAVDIFSWWWTTLFLYCAIFS